MRALVLVGHAFLGNDHAEGTGKPVHHGRAHAAGGGAAGDDHRVHAMEGQQRSQAGLEEGRGHALMDHHVARADAQARIELGTRRAVPDVLQRVRRVRARAPDAAILAAVEIGDIGPDHRPAEVAEAVRQRVGVFHLAWIGLVGGAEACGLGIGTLRVHVHQRGLAPEAEARPGRGGLEREVHLPRRHLRSLHPASLLSGSGPARRRAIAMPSPPQENVAAPRR